MNTTPDGRAARDWYERIDDETLADLLLVDRERTRARLVETVGAPEATEIEKDLVGDRATEGLFDPHVDPNLPEIIWLHGIMGGHLEDAAAKRARLWLNPLAFITGGLSRRLALEADGTTDAFPGSRIEAGGLVRVIYARASRKWRNRGFIVHELGYDWRKGIASAADRLHHFIEAKRAGKKRRFALVAHSMGGLVSAVYAVRHPEHEEAIERAVFMGSPLGGSYAPVEAVLGTFPVLAKLDLVTPHDSMDDLARLTSTLPGLMDMLPSPKLFADAERLYRESAWPSPGPSQRWLDQSAALKQEVVKSPILDKTTLLVGLRHGTVASLASSPGLAAGARDAIGDGTVPARAALIDGVPAFELEHEHMWLPMEPRAIAATAEVLATGEVVSAPRISATMNLETRLAPDPDATLEAIPTQPKLDERIRADDVRWLLDPRST